MKTANWKGNTNIEWPKINKIRFKIAAHGKYDVRGAIRCLSALCCVFRPKRNSEKNRNNKINK